MKRMAAVVAFVATLAGCSGPLRGMHGLPTPEGRIVPPPGKAAVVFMRPATLGWAIASSVFELRNDGDVFVGHVAAKKQLGYFTDPGTTRFMVVSEAADFMGADLEAGRTYYVLVTPRMGWNRARFSLEPITAERVDSREVTEWSRELELVETTAEAREWPKENAESIQKKKEKYLREWNAKDDKPMLRAGDGR